jgi:hypothetical protein
MRFVLADVWGTAAGRQASDGIPELATFWQVPILPAPPNTAHVTCDYPSPRCRVATLTAGAQLQPIPICS